MLSSEDIDSETVGKLKGILNIVVKVVKDDGSKRGCSKEGVHKKARRGGGRQVINE